MSEITNSDGMNEGLDASLHVALQIEGSSVQPLSKDVALFRQEIRREHGDPTSATAGLARLLQAQKEHPIWNNRFFKACLAGQLTKDDCKVVYEQYYLYSKNFTRYLSALMANCESDLHRARISENLWEEGGGLAPEKRHAEIFRRFLVDGLGVDLDNIEFLDSTRLFVHEYLDFCLHSHPAAASAFLSLGTEAIVARMYGIVVEGLLKAGVPEEQLSFFRIHMECDDQHAETLRDIMLSYASMPDWYNTCHRAMIRALDLRERFFEKVYEQLAARRFGPVLENIQNRTSLAPELPSAEDLLHRMGSTTGTPLYSNVNPRLNIDFAVERVQFKAEVFDTRILRIAPRKNNELHKHPHESLFYVIKGEGRVHVNDAVIGIKPGDIVFVPRWAMHQSHNTTDEELLILALTDYNLTEKVFMGNHLSTTRMKGTQAER